MSKSKNNGIMVIGDVHGRFGDMNALINKKKPELVLACGDFGFWNLPTSTRMLHDRDQLGNRVKTQIPKIRGGVIRACDGNHEDHHSLKNAPLDGQLWPNVFYQRRGSTITLPDGRVVLFMGGAESVDKQYRTEGRDWFPEESITQADIDAIPTGKIDIIVSHTCPMEFEMQSMFGNHPERGSRMALSIILEKVQPKEWFFGHWHQRVVGDYYGIRWTALNMLMEPGCWTWL